MYLFAILSSFICIQFILTVSSDTNDARPSSPSDVLVQTPARFNDESESDEEDDYVPRSTSFLRFGRQIPSAAASGAFLRFGRSNPTFLRFGRGGQNGGTFLRFGRQVQQPSSNNFLRFGRQVQQPSSNNFLRFGRKGEFLRFG